MGIAGAKNKGRCLHPKACLGPAYKAGKIEQKDRLDLMITKAGCKAGERDQAEAHDKTEALYFDGQLVASDGAHNLDRVKVYKSFYSHDLQLPVQFKEKLPLYEGLHCR